MEETGASSREARRRDERGRSLNSRGTRSLGYTCYDFADVDAEYLGAPAEYGRGEVPGAGDRRGLSGKR